MEIKKVTDNTFCIDTGIMYIPFYKINDKEIVLLDTGWAKGQRQELEDILDRNGLRPAAILSSHAHVDHVGNNAYFKKKYGCPIAMPAYEALICRSEENLKLYYNSLTLTEVKEHFGHMVCETDIMIMDDQNKIDICGNTFKIIHAPGHSPAHICIITPDDTAYLGDAMISHDVMKGSKIPYAYILKDDLKSKEALGSLKAKKYIVAHKGMYDEIKELSKDNIEYFKERAQKVYEVIDGDMTMEDILKEVIKKFEISVGNRYRYSVIDKMLRSYVEYLNETGMIVLNMDEGFLKYSRCN